MTDELLALNQKLLDAIASGDWKTYQELCADDLTAFEPEAPGQLVVGLDFHRFYFAPGGAKGRHQTTMCNPRVRLIGDAAVVTYTRLVQRAGPDGGSTMTASTETRVWQRSGGGWKHVHFHRTGL
ncbi:MAG: DUF4440 domain-containing protein [Gemmataceae bacterium]